MTSVLVLDDQRTVRAVVGSTLRQAGYEVIEAGDMPSGLAAIRQHRPEAVIADMVMGHFDGHSFLRELRSGDAASQTPVIFYSGSYEPRELMEVARAWGRVSALRKPATGEEILEAVGRAISSAGVDGEEAADREAADERYRQLVNERLLSTLSDPSEAGSDALTDALTGLPNRRALTEMFSRLLAGARRHGRPMGVAMVDIDHFREINETYGHSAGDLVLTTIGRHLRDVARASDFVGRYGGEELLVLMPETPPTGIRTAAEKLRIAVAALDSGVPGGVTVSVGCASFPRHGADSHSLIEATGRALTDAKAGGRNRVAVAGLLR